MIAECHVCGLAPFADREEWARDKERQEIGRKFANPETVLPTYCMTCGRYIGLMIQPELAKTWPPERVQALYDYFDAVAGSQDQHLAERPPVIYVNGTWRCGFKDRGMWRACQRRVNERGERCYHHRGK